jgi:hypothetical protein
MTVEWTIKQEISKENDFTKKEYYNFLNLLVCLFYYTDSFCTIYNTGKAKFSTVYDYANVLSSTEKLQLENINPLFWFHYTNSSHYHWKPKDVSQLASSLGSERNQSKKRQRCYNSGGKAEKKNSD